jgi:FkbM family methyltransferase
MKMTTCLSDVILSLPKLKNEHQRESKTYLEIEKDVCREIDLIFNDTSETPKDFAPFGQIVFPFFNMGAKNSLDLFGLDELIIFSFYWVNRFRYKKVLDIGANIGLHSIILSKCGFEVTLFEPDPIHFEVLERNLLLNNICNQKKHKAAVSIKNGEAEFIRVLGNTTGSHLSGFKNSYGELEKFTVRVVSIEDYIKDADLVKMDVEGHEAEIITKIDPRYFHNTDLMIEVGTNENAKLIFDHLQKNGINMFSQKISWQKAKRVEDLPTSHREGSLFISSKDQMPW